ncbi:hypothetical protein RRG08_056134 [Elysia crispata]|uniref:Uncharacterized protein n=1 Tax=Elysia crispata TaxID=231223 RepID=A0AAE0YV07_9GAST|nr:hypothetical protein RRG08_056134 [Elysia crispata]
MVGKGRRPDVSKMQVLTRKVLVQRNILKEDVDGGFREGALLSLQGETNMLAAQTSRAAQLVAKHLSTKDIPLQDLPSRRTSLIFMEKANHIAKQQLL